MREMDVQDYRVVSGRWFFHLLATHGVPADIAFQECTERKLLPHWGEFIAEAIKQGWSDATIEAKFREMRE